MGRFAWVRRSRSDPSQNKNIKQFYVKTENWRESTKNKEKRGINEHDKIIQYFPRLSFQGYNVISVSPFSWNAMSMNLPEAKTDFFRNKFRTKSGPAFPFSASVTDT
jgi:hypothetical protein